MAKREDGDELPIATRHFALTGRLLPLLPASGDARVTIVTSLAHQGVEIDFDDINSEVAAETQTYAVALEPSLDRNAEKRGLRIPHRGAKRMEISHG